MDDRPDRGRGGTGGGQQKARYDSDLYSWAVEQAALLRAGRIAEADALNIAEELDDVGNEQYDKLAPSKPILNERPKLKRKSPRNALKSPP